MSDLIRGLRYTSEEQEARVTQRAINRLVRAVRESASQSAAPLPLMPRPQFPSGVVPVVLLNPPGRIR